MKDWPTRDYPGGNPMLGAASPAGGPSRITNSRREADGSEGSMPNSRAINSAAETRGLGPLPKPSEKRTTGTRGFVAREPRYEVDPGARIREILGDRFIPDTAELLYSFDGGYERLKYRESEQTGSLHFEGAYHPEGVCEGGGVCRYCGRTLAFD